MSISLHAATVGTYLQILPQVAVMLDKAEEHCRQHGLADDALTGATLAPDMWDFAKQIFECGHHSARAIESVRRGLAGPEMDPVPHDFAALRKEIADSIAALQALQPAEVDSLIGRDVRFEFGTFRMDYTAENFLLSFSLPNFFFHSVTAYDVLRSRGVALGKRDYLGKVRIKPA